MGIVGRDVALLMALANGEDYDIALDMLAPKRGERLLEIGMASGIHAARIAAMGVRYCGIDHSRDMVNMAQAGNLGIEFRCLDVCRDELPECDAALAINTLQWWGDWHGAFLSVKKALSADGKFVIGIPEEPPVGTLPDVGQRYYSAMELASMLRNAGFASVHVWTVDTARRPYLIASARK